MVGGGAFSNVDHLRTLSEERCDGKKYWDAAYESKLKGFVSNFKGTEKSLLLRAKITGDWLSVRGTAVSGTILSATDFRDFLCALYNLSTVNLQSHCNRCGSAFRVTHTLSCSIDGLVIMCHNKIHDKILYLSQRAFTSESVRAEPLIHQGRIRSEQEIHQGSDKEN